MTVTAGQAGDEALKLHLGTGGATDGSIPIVVRALVPVTASGGSFSGTLTGGADSFNAGQEFTYQFNVPAGQPSLNLGVQPGRPRLRAGRVPDRPERRAARRADHGQRQPRHRARRCSSSTARRHPAGGPWCCSWRCPSDGARLTEPFTGALSFTAPSVTATGIPNSASTVLPAGQPVTATIKVTNTGNISKDFFADPRLNGKVPQQLLGTDVNNVPLPLSLTAQPDWLVPTNTNALVVGAQGTVPITMDVSWAFGDPDVLGVSSGNNSVAALAAPEVAPGFFFALPEATGPFTSGTTGTVNLAAVANTNPFDSAVTSTSGDAWAQSVNASAPYSPVTLAPGQPGPSRSRSRPNAAKGTVVRGFIGVDTLNLGTVSGDELVNIPYSLHGRLDRSQASGFEGSGAGIRRRGGGEGVEEGQDAIAVAAGGRLVPA